jgi:DtxR family Mn-dependent transcriptional regulator
MENVSLVILASLTAALVLLPKWGLIARWRESQRMTEKCRREDALKYILKREVNGQTPTLNGVAGALEIHSNKAAELLSEMERRGLISFDCGQLRLRHAGRELALHVIRAHRLWESYLADQTGVEEAKWHHLAERKEHLMTPDEAEELSARLGHPVRDPHGDAIPTVGEELAADAGQSLNSAPLNAVMQIEHIEDEPETVYAQLSAVGIRPGMRVCVFEKSPERIRFWADGQEHVLAPILAHNISVIPLPESAGQDLFDEEFLAGLKPGQNARILGLTTACRGAERRRLLDLGFVPGTSIEVEMVSPGGDPTAYRVRGTLIALRRDQARLIRISTSEAQPL